MVKLTLYSYFRSSCTWRVRATLDLKGIPYEIKTVNIAPTANVQFSDEFLALNPMGQIPVLVVEEENGGRHVLTQSMAIIEFLEERFPGGKSVYPSDPYERAKVRAICDTIVSGIQPLQNLSTIKKAGELGGEPHQWAKEVVEVGFAALEKMLQQTAGKCCVGDQITLADICLVPQVYNADRWKCDMSKFPLISRLSGELEKVDCIAKTHPSRQPDAPNEPDRLGQIE